MHCERELTFNKYYFGHFYDTEKVTSRLVIGAIAPPIKLLGTHAAVLLRIYAYE